MTAAALPRAQARRAITLVELLIVVAIMAVMAGLAAPRFAASAQRRRFQSAALRIQSDVALACESARATSSPRTLRFSTAENSYRLIGDNALTAGRSGSVELDQGPYKAILSYADFDGSPDLVFDGYGRITTTGEVRLQVGTMRGRLTFTAHDEADPPPDPPADEDGGGGDGGGLLGGILGLLGL